MEVTLKFKLPEEREEYEAYYNGPSDSAALDELDNWLRGLWKHTDQENISIEEVRKRIWELRE